MQSDLTAMADRMRRREKALEQDVNQFVTDIVAGVARELARSTPVDTALARSNWITKTGSPFTEIMFPYRAYPSRYTRNARGAFRTGGKFTERINTNAVEEQARLAMTKRRPDEFVFITNNVNYIDALNDGKSSQASAGFVDRAVSVGSMKAIKRFRFRSLEAI